MGLLHSDLHLHLFRSPLLLKVLPHSSQVILSLVGVHQLSLQSLDNAREYWLPVLIQVLGPLSIFGRLLVLPEHN